MTLWAFLHELIHDPLHRDGYQFWSGIGSDFGEASIVFAIVMLIRTLAAQFAHKHVCHVEGCHRLDHPDPEHGWPACRDHHSKRAALGKSPHKPPLEREPVRVTLRDGRTA